MADHCTVCGSLATRGQAVTFSAFGEADPSDVNGSPESVVEKGVAAAADLIAPWLEALVEAASSGSGSALVIEGRLYVAAQQLDLEPLAQHIYEQLLRGVMLGALDAAWEAEHAEVIAPAQFAGAAIGPSGGVKDFVTKPFKEAIDDIKGRQVVTRDVFDALSAEAKAKAFTVAGLVKDDILKTTQEELVSAVEEGKDLRQFGKALKQRYESAGYTPLAPSHLETVFRTNVMTAYGTGRTEQMRQPHVIAARPYWQITGPKDGVAPAGRSRPTHYAARGKVLRADDPFWQTVGAPPWGYNCRCRIVSRSQRDLERLGLSVSTGSDLSGLPDKGFDSRRVPPPAAAPVDPPPAAATPQAPTPRPVLPRSAPKPPEVDIGPVTVQPAEPWPGTPIPRPQYEPPKSFAGLPRKALPPRQYVNESVWHQKITQGFETLKTTTPELADATTVWRTAPANAGLLQDALVLDVDALVAKYPSVSRAQAVEARKAASAMSTHLNVEENLTHDLSVFQPMTGLSDADIEQLITSKSLFTPTITSGTRKPEVANIIAQGKEGHTAVIHYENTMGLGVEHLGQGLDGEILIPPGQRFRVVERSVTKGLDGKDVLVIRVRPSQAVWKQADDAKPMFPRPTSTAHPTALPVLPKVVEPIKPTVRPTMAPIETAHVKATNIGDGATQEMVGRLYAEVPETVAKALEKAPLPTFEMSDDRPTSNGVFWPNRGKIWIRATREADGPGFEALATGKRPWSVSSLASTPDDARKATFVHELGHHVQKHLGPKADKVTRAAFKRAKEADSFATKYASKNHHEYFAESWAAFNLSPSALLAKDPNGHAMVLDVLKLLGLP